MHRRTFLCLILPGATLPLAARAHHGWSGYDVDHPLALTGVIREANYEYPHASIRLETAGKKWLCVLAPPSRMENRGIPRDALKVGTSVSIEGYVHRADKAEMRAERITLGGKTVELR